MQNLKKLLKLLNECRKDYSKLKSELDRKEAQTYFSWRKENLKDRTAWDKVIAEFKSEDEEWQKQEQLLDDLKVDLEIYKNIFSITQSYLQKEEITTEEADKLIESLLEEVL